MRSRRLLRLALPAIGVIAGIAWIAETWSLSSYALVLQGFGARDTGLVLGEPRVARSDEWGVVTPYLQATVNNGFARYNTTSFYDEDLRAFVALPVADWGLAFKPDQWLYPFANAAYAYSFQHLFSIVAFLAGYTLLFIRVGLPAGTAAPLSALLFFTAFVQFWWTTYGPSLAWFPWVVLSLGVDRAAARGAAFLFTAVAWMLALFYPPLLIPLAVVAAALYVCLYAPRRGLVDIALDAAVALAACGIVVFYLQDYLAATWTSIFPGMRRLDGGGVSAAMQLQTLWPTAHLAGFETDLPGFNVCEAGVVGSWYFLAALCFVDPRRLADAWASPSVRRTLAALLVAWLALVAWQSLPIPKDVAQWVLFDRVPPRRTMFASGFLLLLATALIVQAAGLRFTLLRVAAFAIAVAGGAWVASGKLFTMPDVAAVVLAVCALLGGAALRRHATAALAGGSALLGLVAFGPFNPVQSAWPIFNRESTPLAQELDARQKTNPQGVLVSDQFGATLNGWGYRSVAHVLLAPKLDIWRRLYPDMDATERDAIFNRYAHIVVGDVPAPALVNIMVITVPRRVFGDDVPPWLSVHPLAAGLTFHERGGHLDTRRVTGRHVLLAGWAPWRGAAGGRTLELYANVPLSVVSARWTMRPDVARVLRDDGLQDSGFVVEVEAPRGESLPESLALCLVARDAGNPVAVLIEPAAPGCDTRLR